MSLFVCLRNLSICLYRSLLRLESRLCTVSQTQAKRHEVAHRDLLRKEIEFFGALQRSDNSESHETLRALARQSFLLPPESNQDILDRQQTAFLALSLVPTNYNLLKIAESLEKSSVRVKIYAVP